MEKLKIKLEEYKEMFHDDFPTFCFTHLSIKETTSLVEKCLSEELDVYTLGYLEDDRNVVY